MKTKIFLISILALILNVNAYDLNLYSENLTTNEINNTENYLECISAIKSNISVSQLNSFFVYTIKVNGVWAYTDYDIVNDINFNNSYTVALFPDESMNNDLIYVDLIVYNYSNMDEIFYYNNITKTYCYTNTSGTTTTIGTTSTTTNSTSTTVESTTTSGGTTSTLSTNIFISGVQKHFGSMTFGTNDESEYIIGTFSFMISFISLIFLLFVLFVFMNIKY